MFRLLMNVNLIAAIVLFAFIILCIHSDQLKTVDRIIVMYVIFTNLWITSESIENKIKDFLKRINKRYVEYLFYVFMIFNDAIIIYEIYVLDHHGFNLFIYLINRFM